MITAFNKWYNQLPAKDQGEMRKNIIESCDISQSMFYNYLRAKPMAVPKLVREKIAEIAGLRVSKLFPKITTTSNE